MMKKIILFTALVFYASLVFSAKRNRRLSDSKPISAHEFVDAGEKEVQYQTPSLKKYGLFFIARKCSSCGTYRIGHECGHNIFGVQAAS